ncbi:MAG: glutamine--fructose-6-phosphate transaminase (isomerizing) [Ruminococcaceae bacterium]|nr:glutamine--fructose-6-phosphate transaminase (isomerizing) [Oscillospiraceae bacterium]
MCGIIGCTGAFPALDVLRGGLRALEYRGYDSAGIAFFNADSDILTVKASGKIKNLEDKLDTIPDSEKISFCGIGHTRWATHGEPTERNAHPHGNDRVQIVHNGIIENYRELSVMLSREGYSFKSETDTEVASLLIDFSYKKQGNDPLKALAKARSQLEGSYAIGAVFSDRAGEIYAMRRDNPLIIGLGESESFIASDITAILPYTRKYIRLGENEIARLSGKNVTVFDEYGNACEKQTETALWDVDSAKKGGYPHFMIKEIYEEPDALAKTLAPRISSDLLPNFEGENIDVKRLASSKRIIITACGTAMHAGFIAKYFIEKYARIPVNVEIASEMRYSDMIIDENDAVIVISQSGETADTLAALRLAKNKGAFVTSVVNVVGSTIARESDAVIYTWAGPEIAVASTKAYVVQSALMSLLALAMSLEKKILTESEVKALTGKLLHDLPSDIKYILDMRDEIYSAAQYFADKKDLFCVGRGIDYFAAVEASLKIKEVSYIHSEAYAAGEMKHGTISLIENGTPVIVVSTDKNVRQKIVGNIRELASRGAYIISLSTPDREISDVSDKMLSLPSESGEFLPIAVATLLQMIAYRAAVLKGCDVDCPRNLAKSVTVE